MAVGIKTAAMTALALAAFASNSLLTRLALGSRDIDAASFTAIRLASGAVVLTLVARVLTGTWTPLRGRGVKGPLALFAYAVPFTFAYLRIGAAVGALVLFGMVQLTMIAFGLFRGERLAALSWAGVALATFGLATLTLPSATSPDPLGLMLMSVAGVAWGLYSILGKATADPLAANARSFVWSSLPAMLVVAASHVPVTTSGRGIVLALISGAITSGLGYVVWYRALSGLTVTQAAVSQLSVPVIAAAGAAALLSERLTAQLVISGTAVLSGVGIVLSARSRRRA